MVVENGSGEIYSGLDAYIIFNSNNSLVKASIYQPKFFWISKISDLWLITYYLLIQRDDGLLPAFFVGALSLVMFRVIFTHAKVDKVTWSVLNDPKIEISFKVYFQITQKVDPRIQI